MNIKEAKEEIVRTIRAYLKKDELGAYEIPVERQRPVLIMGPPGIGKTAIMRQIAEEMNIGLVSYTITHHTRQSAIGLPFISKKEFGGREYSVTEYTMSEIVASVYDHIAKSGRKEGILFLDEINCVSETLVPTMLQFLQMKTFGTHKLPDGFVLVCAGNPPEYNRSVRDFDIVTLDRVKRLDVLEDLEAFTEYAAERRIHAAVTSYLSIHPDHFYSVKNEADGRHFVTARAWEDLAGALAVYEELGQPVTEGFVGAYLQDPEIAAGFLVYYELWNRYRNVYQVPEILAGTAPARPEMKSAPFDEKVSLIALLSDAVTEELAASVREKAAAKSLFEDLKALRTALQCKDGTSINALVFLRDTANEKERSLGAAHELGLISRENETLARLELKNLKEIISVLAKEGHGDAVRDFDLVRGWFAAREAERKARIASTGERLANVFHFLNESFGEGQEMVMFLSQLSKSKDAMRFITENGSEAYFTYSRLLLLKDRREELKAEIMSL